MSSKLKIAYFGTPYFSARFLEKLITDPKLKEKVEVKLVITQADKPVGRKQIMTPTPVKQVAIKYQIPVCRQAWSNINYQNEIGNWKLEIGNLDLCLVYAYGQLIPKEFLSLPKYGFWCIHPSLLPKYRGPSPVAYPLILGDEETGVTIFQMDEKIDHGSIIDQKKLTVKITDYRTDLEVKLTDLAFQIFKKIIIQLTSLRVNELKSKKTCRSVNPLILKPQNHQYATYTRLLKKEDGFIPLQILKKTLKNKPLTFEELPKIIKEYVEKYQKANIKKQNNIEKFKITKNSSKIIYDYFRGLFFWPGVWTTLPNGKRLKITEMKIDNNNQLLITKVQLEGKKEVDFETFNRAYKIF